MKQLLFCLCSVLSSVNSSHFRGIFSTWKLTAPNTISLSYQLSIRRSDTYCTQAHIENQTPISISNWFRCRSGCSSQSSSYINYVCLEFSTSEDWTLATASQSISLSNDIALFSMSSCCWITLSKHIGDTNIKGLVKVNTTARVDTGRPNTAPNAVALPLVKLLHQCSHTIRIPVFDQEGDIIRCRKYQTIEECGYESICQGPSGLLLDEDTCHIYYNATENPGMYGLHIQIEDFRTEDPSTPLSSVPLQFLINIFTSTLPCDSNPYFIPPSPAEGYCKAVTDTFNITLVARTRYASQSITRIMTQGPLGMTKSALQPYDTSGREWYVQVTWTPSPTDLGNHLFCFSAEADQTFASVLQCIDLLVTTEIPVINLFNQEVSPRGGVLPGTINLSLRFNKRFSRPTSSKYIYIYEASNDTLVHIIDVTDTRLAMYPPSNAGQLTVKANFNMTQTKTYYVLADQGVAAGFHTCSVEWAGIQNSSFWTFTILDIPPELTFTFSPMNSTDNTTITWSVTEEVSAFCEVVGPDFHQTESCDEKWSSNFLICGNYYLEVTIIDATQNAAGPFRYEWFNEDTTPPALTFSSPLPSLTHESVTLQWESNEPALSNCTLVTSRRITKVPCDGRWTGENLPEGQVTLSILLTDTSNNTSQVYTHSWYNEDVTPPVLTFTQYPATSNDNITITWSVSEDVTAFCEVVGPRLHETVTCDGEWGGHLLPRGNYYINVTVTDYSQNTAGPFRHEWFNDDTSPPTLFYTSPLPNITHDSVTLWWGSNEIVTSQCTVTTSKTTQMVPCDGEWTGKELPEGTVSLSIILTDDSGNSSPEYTYSWYNDDITLPVLMFTSAPSQSTNDIGIMWTSSEEVTSNCTLIYMTQSSMIPCDSSFTRKRMLGGKYKLVVTSSDTGGNYGSPLIHEWLNVDTIPPLLTFTSNPLQTFSNATISWTVDETGVNSSCIIITTTVNYTDPCYGSWTGLDLREGQHNISIRLIDTSNNVAGPFYHSWFNEDVTPPSLTFTTNDTIFHEDVTISWVPSEEIVSICHIRTPIEEFRTPCDKSWSALDRRGGEYILGVEMTDMSGNTAEETYIFTIDANETVFRVAVTFDNVILLDLSDKTSPTYSELKHMLMLTLAKYYSREPNSLKEVYIYDITKRNNKIVVDHDVIFRDRQLKYSASVASKHFASLLAETTSININGTVTKASLVHVKKPDDTEAVFSRQTSACDVYQEYVPCTIWEQCDENYVRCRKNGKEEQTGLIIGIGLGAAIIFVGLLTSLTVAAFIKRRNFARKATEEKRNSKINVYRLSGTDFYFPTMTTRNSWRTH